MQGEVELVVFNDNKKTSAKHIHLRERFFF